MRIRRLANAKNYSWALFWLALSITAVPGPPAFTLANAAQSQTDSQSERRLPRQLYLKLLRSNQTKT